MSRSVIHRFIRSAQVYPGKPALCAREELYTYAELSAIAEAARLALAAQGIVGAQRVGVMTGDGVATYAAILAILANGCAYVPINSKNPAARNLDIIEDAGITALLYEEHSELMSRVADDYGERCKLVHVSGVLPAEAMPLRISWTDDPPLAYLFFTSGSTGKPKGVPISHASLNHFMGVMIEEGIYDFRPDDKFLQMFELTFDLSVMSLFVPLGIGACCYVVPESRVGAMAVLKTLQRHSVSVALMVPSLLTYLEPYLARISLPDLRCSLFCGEALPDSLAEKWHLTAPNSMIENVYGPTEATIFCLRYPWDPVRSPPAAVNGVVPIGKPLPGTGVALVDGEGKLLAGASEKGQLLLTGPQLSSGYWQDPDKTAAAYILIAGPNGPVTAYRTGDLCSINRQGDFIYHGRLDSQVKIDGHRVELGEIEHHLREVLGRTSLAVVVINEGGRSVLALFLEKPEVDAKNLADELKVRIPDYMVPRQTRYIDKLPLNLNGKVDRPRLTRMFDEARANV